LGFFKKKKRKQEIVVESQEIPDKEELMIKIEKAKNLLKDSNGKERIEILNQIGKLYFEAGEYDKAIDFYELSISENRSLGQAYTDLLKLYNLKRKEAVDHHSDSDVQLYLKKIDDLLKLSKDVIRGKVKGE